jgi:hypothetical protein
MKEASMPPEDRLPLLSCTQEFERVRGEIARLKNGHTSQAKALDTLTTAVERGNAVLETSQHQMATKLDDFMLRQENRITKVEERAKSAHHRVDGLLRVLISLGTGAAITILGYLFAVGKL